MAPQVGEGPDMLQWHSLNMDLKKRVHLNEKNHDSGSSTLDIDVDHAGLYAGIADYRLHLLGDVIEAVVEGRTNLYDSLHILYLS